MPTSKGTQALALGVCVLSLSFVGWRVAQSRPSFEEERPAAASMAESPGAPSSNRPGAPAAPVLGPPTEEERTQMREEIFAAVDLTPEQREAVEEIRARRENGNVEDARAGMSEFMAVLTPEQRVAFMQAAGSRIGSRMNRMMQALPPQEQVKLQEKIAERGLPFGPGARPNGGREQ